MENGQNIEVMGILQISRCEPGQARNWTTKQKKNYNNYKLYCDRNILTHQRAMHNRPDLVLIDK